MVIKQPVLSLLLFLFLLFSDKKLLARFDR